MKLHIPSKTMHALIMKGGTHFFKTDDVIQSIKETTTKNEVELSKELENIRLNSEDGYTSLQGKGYEDFETPSQFNSEYIARLKYRIKELEQEKEILQEQFDNL